VAELHAATGRSPVNHLGRLIELPHTLLGTVLDALLSEQSEPPAATD
jgi:hypothetical protein